MPDEEIVKEEPLTMVEMREELEEVKKRDKELNLRALKTFEYINQFTNLKSKEAKELYEKIEKLQIPRLRDQQIKKIIDLTPKTVDELKVVLQGYTLSVNNENMKKIVKVINESLKA